MKPCLCKQWRSCLLGLTLEGWQGNGGVAILALPTPPPVPKPPSLRGGDAIGYWQPESRFHSEKIVPEDITLSGE